MKRLKGIYHMLRCPTNYLKILSQEKNKSIFAVILFFLLGIVLQQYWNFPCFYIFVSIFLFIGILCVWAVIYFLKKINFIIAAIISQPAAEKANNFYLRHCEESNAYIIAPVLVILIFGIGGCFIYGAIELSPTLIWVLLLFSVVVYISIVGYLQYITLAIYIFNLVFNGGQYRQLSKSVFECIPSELKWLQELTKLSHTYRSCFFTLGCGYIVAYGAFCYLPEMKTNTTSYVSLSLWIVIFFAIVLLFPVVSLLEYKWIKIIVTHLKTSYITDLEIEGMLWDKTIDIGVNSKFFSWNLIHNICAIQILESKPYPITSRWEILYASVLSLFNFTATTLTILQGIPMFSNVFLRIA